MTSKVFPQGVRQMEISKPTKIGLKSSTLRGRIILVAKFDFVAESPDELTVSKGDVLKLLDRLTNGWVHVESIERIAASGLVPSLYVDIAINDSDHPITMSWLHETLKDKSSLQNTFNDIQVQMLLNSNSPLTINNRPYPLTASVVSYLACEDRFWYRVDVTYSTSEHGYLCRYYLDFFDLHAALLEYIAEYDASQLSASSAKGTPASPEVGSAAEQPPIRLPRLPEPIMIQNQKPELQAEVFSKRCKELSTYLNVLIADKRLQVCHPLVDWLESNYNNQPGFVAEKILNDSSEAIAQQLVPNSALVASQMNTIPPKASELSKIANASCYSALPKGVLRTKSLNLPNNQNPNSPQISQACPFIGRSLSVKALEHTRPETNLSKTRTISIIENLRASQGIDSQFEPPPLPKLSLSSSSPPTPPRNVFVPQRVPSQTKNPPQHPPVSLTPPRTSPPQVTTTDVISPKRPPMSAPERSDSKFSPSFSPSNARAWDPKISSKNKLVLRCEIKTPSNDTIVVKFNQAEITSVYVFKSLLQRKVRFTNVYVRFYDTESYEEFETLDFELYSRLKKATAVYVLLT